MTQAHRDPRTLINWDALDKAGWNFDIHNTPLAELLPILRTRLAWDIIPDDLIVPNAKAFGLTAPSEDVAKIEAAAAQIRRNRVTPFYPALTALATASAELISTARIVGRGETGSSVPGNVKTDEAEIENLEGVVLASALGIVANLLDMDILTYGKALRP